MRKKSTSALILSNCAYKYLRADDGKPVMAVGTACDVLSAFLVTFFTPYIQNGPQIQLGARTAFIWMGCSIIAFFFCFLAVPELKVGRFILFFVSSSSIPRRSPCADPCAPRVDDFIF
jgi:hypothetical protein